MNTYNFYIGFLFFIIHSLLFFSSAIVYFFSENLIVQLILLINTTVIYIFNCIYNNCPIDIIEKYYLKDYSFASLSLLIIPRDYNTKENNTILQFIFTFLIIICVKIIVILFKKLKNVL